MWFFFQKCDQPKMSHLAGWAQDDCHASSHVLAAVVTAALHHSLNTCAGEKQQSKIPSKSNKSDAVQSSKSDVQVTTHLTCMHPCVRT